MLRHHTRNVGGNKRNMKKIIAITLFSILTISNSIGQKSLDYDMLFDAKFGSSDRTHYYRIIGDSILVKKSRWHSYAFQTNGGKEVLLKLKEYDKQLDTIRCVTPLVNVVSSGKNIMYDSKYETYMKVDALPSQYYKNIPELSRKSQYNILDMLSKWTQKYAIEIAKTDSVWISLSSFNEDELITKATIAEKSSSGEEKYTYFINTKCIHQFTKKQDGKMVREVQYISSKTYPNNYKFTDYLKGKPKYSGQYKEGKKNGKWKYYDDDGNILKTEKYKLGVLAE